MPAAAGPPRQVVIGVVLEGGDPPQGVHLVGLVAGFIVTVGRPGGIGRAPGIGDANQATERINLDASRQGPRSKALGDTYQPAPDVQSLRARSVILAAGLVFGWVFAAHQLGAATAAYGAGLTRALLLTYNPALFAAGAACLLAALMAMAIVRMQAV